MNNMNWKQLIGAAMLILAIVFTFGYLANVIGIINILILIAWVVSVVGWLTLALWLINQDGE